MGEKKSGRIAGVKWELPSKIFVFLKEIKAFDDDWINERTAPIEFSALGLSKIFKVTENDIHDATKPYHEEESKKKKKEFKRSHKEAKDKKYIVRKKMKLFAKDKELNRTQFVYLLTPLGQEIADGKLNKLKKSKIHYRDENNKLIIRSIEELYNEIIERYGTQNRFFCNACLADFVDKQEEIYWKDFLEAIPFKLDIQFQVKDDENITIKEFIKKHWPKLNTLIESMTLEPLNKYNFDDLFYPLNFTQIKKSNNELDKRSLKDINNDIDNNRTLQNST